METKKLILFTSVLLTLVAAGNSYGWSIYYDVWIDGKDAAEYIYIRQQMPKELSSHGIIDIRMAKDFAPWNTSYYMRSPLKGPYDDSSDYKHRDHQNGEHGKKIPSLIIVPCPRPWKEEPSWGIFSDDTYLWARVYARYFIKKNILYVHFRVRCFKHSDDSYSDGVNETNAYGFWSEKFETWMTADDLNDSDKLQHVK